MRVLVIGGTLFIGKPLVERLVRAGHEVAILHRKPGHNFGGEVEELIGDRNDGESVRRALSGRSFDAVFDNVYDWERGSTAEQVVATARACGGNLSLYVFMSSIGAYEERLNRRESDPLWVDSPIPYCRNKATSEQALFEMHADEGFPAVTLRPPFIYGPGNPFYREQFFWDRMRDNRPIIIPGDGQRLMQFVYVKDLVWACLRVLEEPKAVGEAFNIAAPRPLTQEAMVRAFGRAAGVEPKLVNVPRERIEAAREGLYVGEVFDLPPITEITGKAERILGFETTAFDEGLQETQAWYLKQPRRSIDYRFEDSLLEN